MLTGMDQGVRTLRRGMAGITSLHLPRVRRSARRLARRLALASVTRILGAPPVRRLLTRRARRAWRRVTSVVFVCAGNICRSPFAEAIARRRAGEDADLVSAGFFPVEGRPSPAEAVAAAQRMDVDLSAHRSRATTPQMLARADAVFVFDADNCLKLLRASPRAALRAHPLGALAPDGDIFIDDPFNEDLSCEDAYARIEQVLSEAPRG